MSDFLRVLQDDAYAATFQTMGQYRTALIAAYRERMGKHEAQLTQESNASVVRRFRNKGGFYDDTDYIHIQPNGDAYIVKRNGFSEKTLSYDIETCLAYVSEGKWVELSNGSAG